MGVALPVFSQDDVLNFMVTEAIMVRGMQDEVEKAKNQEREDWKNRPLGSGAPEGFQTRPKRPGAGQPRGAM